MAAVSAVEEVKERCKNFLNILDKIVEKLPGYEKTIRDELRKRIEDSIITFFGDLGLLLSREDIDSIVEYELSTIISAFNKLYVFKPIWTSNVVVIPYPHVILVTFNIHMPLIYVWYGILRIGLDHGHFEVPIVKILDYVIRYPQALIFVSPTIMYVKKESFNAYLFYALYFSAVFPDILQSFIMMLVAKGEDVEKAVVDARLAQKLIALHSESIVDTLATIFPEYFAPVRMEIDVEPKVVIELHRKYGEKFGIEIEDEVFNVVKRCKLEFTCVENYFKRTYNAFKLSELL